MEFFGKMSNVCTLAKRVNVKLFQHMLLICRHGSQNPLRRRPIRVLNPNPSETLETKGNYINEQKCDPGISARVEKQLVNVSQKAVVRSSKQKKKSVIVPTYVKLPEADDRLIKTLTTIKSRQLREKSGKILLEGKRLINDAISAGVELKTLFFSKEETLAEINVKETSKVELYKVLYRTLRVWSGVTTCPGIMGVFKQPTNDQISVLNEPVIPVTVLCDNIRDPGNMGSIIRSAAAAGCRNILLTQGCVDPWEQKVLRTGMGSHFRIPIINNIPWEHVINYLPRSSSVYLADNSADIDLLDSDIINEVDYVEDAEGYNSEERYVYKTEEEEYVLTDNTYVTEAHLQKYKELYLPCYLYSSIRYPKDDIVIYVGGETHGVSPQANKLACEFGGVRVKLPLENEVDSLNSSFALAIILYEIKRQQKESYVTKEIK